MDVPRHLQVYAMSFPAAPHGDWAIKQGHVDYCELKGHATAKVDGVVQPYCPRCGAVL